MILTDPITLLKFSSSPFPRLSLLTPPSNGMSITIQETSANSFWHKKKETSPFQKFQFHSPCPIPRLRKEKYILPKNREKLFHADQHIKAHALKPVDQWRQKKKRSQDIKTYTVKKMHLPCQHSPGRTGSKKLSASRDVTLFTDGSHRDCTNHRRNFLSNF